LIPLLNAIIVN